MLVNLVGLINSRHRITLKNKIELPKLIEKKIQKKNIFVWTFKLQYYSYESNKDPRFYHEYQQTRARVLRDGFKGINETES